MNNRHLKKELIKNHLGAQTYTIIHNIASDSFFFEYFLLLRVEKIKQYKLKKLLVQLDRQV